MSSHGGCGVVDLGKGYPGVEVMPLAALVRDDTGDSPIGEKYESAAGRSPGDGAPRADSCVWRLSGTGGGGRGYRGGGARAMPASDCVLSPVADLCLRLLLDAFLGIIVPPVEGVTPKGIEPGLYSSSSSMSCSLYGFSIVLRTPAWALSHGNSGGARSGLDAAFESMFALRCLSRPAAHLRMVSSFVNLMVKFSTPGSPFHQICTL